MANPTCTGLSGNTMQSMLEPVGRRHAWLPPRPARPACARVSTKAAVPGQSAEPVEVGARKQNQISLGACRRLGHRRVRLESLLGMRSTSAFLDPLVGTLVSIARDAKLKAL